MDTNLIINFTNGGKKGSKAISNINPDKDNTILKTFAQMFNGLSTNTYVDATRVDKMSVEETGGVNHNQIMTGSIVAIAFSVIFYVATH